MTLPTFPGNNQDVTSDGTIWGDVMAFFSDVWQDLIELVTDLVAWIVDLILSAFMWLVGQMPVPDFMTIDWSGIAPLFYFAHRMGVDVALGIYGSGLAFRLLRKLMTVGQW